MVCLMNADVVVAISVGILVALFTAQRFGTNAVGGAFAPILLTWLFSIAGEPLVCRCPAVGWQENYCLYH